MKRWKCFGASVALLSAAGCNIGNAPEPMSPSEARSAVDKLPPEKQIEWYNRSPMPPAEKAKKIAEIKAKAGITDGPSGGGAPGAPPVTGN